MKTNERRSLFYREIYGEWKKTGPIVKPCRPILLKRDDPRHPHYFEYIRQERMFPRVSHLALALGYSRASITDEIYGGLH